MKMLTLAVLSLLTITGIEHLQTRTSMQQSKDSIEIAGSKLRLGMTKSEVEGKLSGAQIDREDDRWTVMAGEEWSLVHFENGRLIFAERTWHGKDNDIVDALFGAVSYFNNEGRKACSVYADTVPNPMASFERVWITCGQKSILIVRSTVNGKTGDEVSEHLGMLK